MCESAVLVQGCQHIALGIQPFLGLIAQVRRRQRIGADLVEIVEMGAVLAADLDDIDEAGCGEQGGTRAAPLQQGVGGDGRSVHKLGVRGRVTC